jgi:hypothetical protein
MDAGATNEDAMLGNLYGIIAAIVEEYLANNDDASWKIQHIPSIAMVALSRPVRQTTNRRHALQGITGLTAGCRVVLCLRDVVEKYDGELLTDTDVRKLKLCITALRLRNIEVNCVAPEEWRQRMPHGILSLCRTMEYVTTGGDADEEVALTLAMNWHYGLIMRRHRLLPWYRARNDTLQRWLSGGALYHIDVTKLEEAVEDDRRRIVVVGFREVLMQHAQHEQHEGTAGVERWQLVRKALDNLRMTGNLVYGVVELLRAEDVPEDVRAKCVYGLVDGVPLNGEAEVVLKKAMDLRCKIFMHQDRLNQWKVDARNLELKTWLNQREHHGLTIYSHEEWLIDEMRHAMVEDVFAPLGLELGRDRELDALARRIIRVALIVFGVLPTEASAPEVLEDDEDDEDMSIVNTVEDEDEPWT